MISRSSNGVKDFQFILRFANGVEKGTEADIFNEIGLWSDDSSFRLLTSAVRCGSLTSATSNVSDRVT